MIKSSQTFTDSSPEFGDYSRELYFDNPAGSGWRVSVAEPVDTIQIELETDGTMNVPLRVALKFKGALNAAVVGGMDALTTNANPIIFIGKGGDTYDLRHGPILCSKMVGLEYIYVVPEETARDGFARTDTMTMITTRR